MMVARNPIVERTRRQRGLTLLEMVAVLVILAIVATIAVEMAEPQMDQARYDASVKTLESVRKSICGVASLQSAGSRDSLRSFVADNGRLPLDLTELLYKPADAVLLATNAYEFDSDRDGHKDVRLSGGWHGPYLTLPTGKSTLTDAWGTLIQYAVDPTDPAARLVTSLGRNGATIPPEVEYDQDITLRIAASDYAASVTFRLYELKDGDKADPAPDTTANERLAVVFYGVNAKSDAIDDARVEEVLLEVPFLNDPADWASGQTVLLEHTRFQTMGNFAARAILWTDTNNDKQLDSGEVIKKKSAVKYFTAIGGDVLREELLLR